MSGQMTQRFDEKLLAIISAGIGFRVKDEMKLMLIKDLAKESDDWGMLLHYAALYNNTVMIRQLIQQMEAEVDCLNCKSETPLMVAVEKGSVKAVEALLEFNANIDIANARGKTALQLIFSVNAFGARILTAFVDHFKRDSMTKADIAEKLFKAGCTMSHAAWLRDVDIMKCLLERSVSIDSKGCYTDGQMTALHIAVLLGDLDVTQWLLDNKADFNALDSYGEFPLWRAAFNGATAIVELLLKRGANPNIKSSNGLTPLCVTFVRAIRLDDAVKCMELLLEYGAVLQKSKYGGRAILDLLLSLDKPKAVKLLIAHLAILHKRAMPIADTVINDELHEHPEMLAQLQKDYDKCREMLESKLYGQLTLFDLLNEGEDKMRFLVRNESLMSQIKRINCRLGRSCPFYFKLLKKYISNAMAITKLEDEAILVLCKLLKRSYNQCYNFARQIVGYLSEYELEQLRRA